MRKNNHVDSEYLKMLLKVLTPSHFKNLKNINHIALGNA